MTVLDDLPIPGEWIAQGGAATLLAIVVIMILTGRLVPRSFYRELEKERDYWREAARTSLGHAETLMPSTQIVTDVMRALAGATGVHDEEERR